MNVLISVDENYLKYADTVLYSLRKNVSEAVDVYVLNASINESAILKIKKKMKKHDINIIDVKTDLVKYLPPYKGSYDFTIDTYFRCFAQFLLPEDLDRVLYIDVDMVINGDMDWFYHQSFDDNYLIVCQDVNDSNGKMRKHKEVIGIQEERYFNAGLILMNLSKLRVDTSFEDVLNLICKSEDRFEYLDQDTLNCLYHGHVRFLDWKKYNFQTVGECCYSKKELSNATVIHYLSSYKPWKWIILMHRQENIYWKYRIRCKPYDLTLCAAIRMVHFICRNGNRLKHMIRK